MLWLTICYTGTCDNTRSGGRSTWRQRLSNHQLHFSLSSLQHIRQQVSANEQSSETFRYVSVWSFRTKYIQNLPARCAPPWKGPSVIRRSTKRAENSPSDNEPDTRGEPRILAKIIIGCWSRCIRRLLVDHGYDTKSPWVYKIRKGLHVLQNEHPALKLM